MDYKRVIKSRNMRIAIMQMLSFIPDRLMLAFQYKVKTGRKLELKNPKRFTEKLQWCKLYYRDPLMQQCVDKYDVRQYVEACGLSSILNECYGIYNSPEDIDFDALPPSFVLKDTLGGGGNSIIIVTDKKKENKEVLYRKMWKWVNTPYRCKHPAREWVYDGRKHRIIAEKYIESVGDKGGLIDWKFFCFNGKTEYIYVIADREMGQNAGLGIYTRQFERLPYCRTDERPLQRNVQRPKNYEQMITYAENLAKPFPEARIDFYNQNGIIIFGEITFFDGSGYMKFEPDEFNFEAGNAFTLPNQNRK